MCTDVGRCLRCLPAAKCQEQKRGQHAVQTTGHPPGRKDSASLANVTLRQKDFNLGVVGSFTFYTMPLHDG